MKAIDWLKLIKDPILREKALKCCEDYPDQPNLEVNGIREAILYASKWKSGDLIGVEWNDLYQMPPELISSEESMKELTEGIFLEDPNLIKGLQVTEGLLNENPKISEVDIYYTKVLNLVSDAEKNLSSDDYQFFLADLHRIYMQNFSRNPSNPVFAAYDVRIKEYFQIHQNQNKAIDGLKKFSSKMKNLCLEMAYEKIFERICKEKGIDPETENHENLVYVMELAQEEVRIFKKENI